MDFNAFHIPIFLTTPEAQTYFLGICAGGTVRLFRACLRWFKKLASSGNNHYTD